MNGDSECKQTAMHCSELSPVQYLNENGIGLKKTNDNFPEKVQATCI